MTLAGRSFLVTGGTGFIGSALVRALVMFASTATWARAAGVRLVVFDPPTLWVRSLAGSFSLVCTFYAMTRLPVAEVLTLTRPVRTRASAVTSAWP